MKMGVRAVKWLSFMIRVHSATSRRGEKRSKGVDRDPGVAVC